MTPEFDLSDPDAVAFCPSCGSGYTARATRCEPCGVALVPRAQLEAASTERERSDADEADDAESTVLLCRIDDPATADVLRGELEQAGVPYWARSAQWASLGGAPSFVEFRVPARDMDEARDVLRRIQESERGHPIDGAEPDRDA